MDNETFIRFGLFPFAKFKQIYHFPRCDGSEHKAAELLFFIGEFDRPALQDLKPGQFIGSISFITDETAPTNIVALEPTRYVCWSKSTLKSYLTKNPELHAAIQATLSIDLTKRLQDTWAQK